MAANRRVMGHKFISESNLLTDLDHLSLSDPGRYRGGGLSGRFAVTVPWGTWHNSQHLFSKALITFSTFHCRVSPFGARIEADKSLCFMRTYEVYFYGEITLTPEKTTNRKPADV